MNEGFSNDSISFGLMSESTDSSDEEVGAVYWNCILRFFYLFRNERMAFPLAIHLNSSKSDEVCGFEVLCVYWIYTYSR